MFRLESQGRIRKLVRRNADDWFPLSSNIHKYVEAKTLPFTDAAHLDSSFQCVKNQTFGRLRDSKSHSEGSVAELVANPLFDEAEVNPDDDNDHAAREAQVDELRHIAEYQVGSARAFQIEEPWKTLTLAELDTAVGFSQICPQGLTMQQAGHILEWPERAFAESAVFDKQQEDTEEFYRPREESDAREFLSVAEEEIYLWAGCGQRPLADADGKHYCCPSVPKKEYESSEFFKRQQHRSAVRNQRVECERNKGIWTHMSNRNVNQLTPLRKCDNQNRYISVYAFVPMNGERTLIKEEILNQDSYLRRDLTMEELAKLYPAEIELGFMELHSGLEQSVDRDLKARIQCQTHSFKSETPAFQRVEQRLLLQDNRKGPAYPNESQLYQMAEMRLLNIELNR